MKLIRQIMATLSQGQEERDLQRLKQAIDWKTPPSRMVGCVA